MDDLQLYTFEYLLTQALSRVPDTIDKREGSIIYDALAPACYALSEFYIELNNAYNNVFIDTAVGTYLDAKVAERGLVRNEATFAQRRIDFTDTEGETMEVEIGTRFSTISSTNPIIFVVTGVYKDGGGTVVPGAYICTCETGGTAGNSYTGEMAAVSNVNGLGSAILSTLIVPAEDTETDDDLRKRFKASIVSQSYGGNRAEYENDWILPIQGVGACQIYPVWNGGGTVLISIVDTLYNPVSAEFINQVKEQLDPTDYEGEGLGIVPIGHTVTVTTATEVTLPVSVTIELEYGYSVQDVEQEIIDTIQAEIDKVKEKWGEWSFLNSYSLALYQSHILSSLLLIQGIVNVSQVLINNANSDYIFTETSTTQEIPKLGEVTINV